MEAELFGYIAGTLTTICFVPQAYKVIRENRHEGISISMYLIFFCGICSWLTYGILIKNNPIIVFNSITIILTAIILFKLLKARNV